MSPIAASPVRQAATWWQASRSTQSVNLPTSAASSAIASSSSPQISLSPTGQLTSTSAHVTRELQEISHRPVADRELVIGDRLTELGGQVGPALGHRLQLRPEDLDPAAARLPHPPDSLAFSIAS